MSTPIPQPKGLPLVGNVLDIKPSNTWHSLKKLAENHGEIFKVTILGHSIVFIAGAHLAEEICDEKRFRKYVGGPIIEIRAAVHDALFTAYDHEASWGIHHRVIAPKLTPQVMTDHFFEMRDVTAELVQQWKVLSNNKISLLEQLNRLNLEATTFTLYGQRLNSLDGPIHPMIQAMETSTSEAILRPTRPGFVNWLLHSSKFKKSIAVMRKYAQEVLDHRKANPTDRNDLLATMMTAKDPETSTGLTDSQIIDEVVTMPIGSSTAPCLLTSTIYHLLKNPSVVATARQEVDSIIGDGDFKPEHLPQLKYIEAIIREGLRLSNPAPGFNIEPIPSESKAPILLGGGKYEIPYNQPLIIVLAGVNRDPTVFENPLEFRPERMMGDGFAKLPKGATRWFGNGKRECIGKYYAWQWSVMTLAQIIRDVDFEMVDGNYDLEKVGMDGWFNVRPVGFEVRVKPRAV